jgi:hypothetical protein
MSWVNLYTYQKLAKSLRLPTSHYTDYTVVHIVTTVLDAWNTYEISGFRPVVVGLFFWDVIERILVIQTAAITHVVTTCCTELAH